MYYYHGAHSLPSSNQQIFSAKPIQVMTPMISSIYNPLKYSASQKLTNPEAFKRPWTCM
jgi:hypothetical protein